MKKLALLCAIGCILASSAFAQLSVGAYAKSNWIPYRLTVPAEGDALHTTAVQVPWGGPDIGAGANFDGWTEWGGLHLGIDIAYGAAQQAGSPFSAIGSGWVWAKPFAFIPRMETFALYFGTPNDEHLTGKITGSSLSYYVLDTSYIKHKNQYRMEYANPEYNTFTRINPYSWGNADNKANTYWPRVGGAAMLTWEPVERLFIGAFVAPELFNVLDWAELQGDGMEPVIDSANGPHDLTGLVNSGLGNDDTGFNQDYYDVNKVYRKMQIAAGYDIPGIGFARLQYIGMRNTVEAAFQVKSLGDLVLDIGLKIPFEDANAKAGESFYKRKNDFQASVAATYRNYDFRLTGRVDTAFLGSDSYSQPGKVLEGGLNMVVYLVPTYQLEVGTVGLDLGFEYEQKDDINGYAENSAQAGFGLWFLRDLGNAKFRAALVSRLPLEWNGVKSNFDFFIPLTIEVGF